MMFEEQQRAAARQESDSLRFYAMQHQFAEQFARLEQHLTQQVLSQCQPMDPNSRTATLRTRQLPQPTLPAPTVVPGSQPADPVPQWEYTEPDYSDELEESDEEEPLEVAPSDAPTKGEVQAILKILRDALGISVTATEPKPSEEKAHFSIFTKGKLAAGQPQPLAFPIDPGVADRAADISIKKSRPLGAELHILQDDQAAVVSNTPVPEDVWDRLLLNNKARISGGTGSTTQEKRVCRLSDKKDAEAVRSELVRLRGQTRDRGFRLNPLHRRVAVEGRGRLRRHHSAGQDLHVSHPGKVPEKSLGPILQD